MTYTRKDLEADIQEHLSRIELELRGLDSSANDGTLEDAKQKADRRHELRQRARELEAHLAESRAKRSDGGYQEALMRQVRRVHTSADVRRVEMDAKVQEHAKRTGDTYIGAANKLRERGELDV